MDVCIVCHTEFGFVRNKHISFAKDAHEGVTRGVVNLAELAEACGAKITFAVCPETAEYFPRGLPHEVGLHVHAGWEVFRDHDQEWIVGDSYLRKHCEQGNDSTNLNDHTLQEQREMIQKGKEYVQHVLRESTKVFVAGRWALNNDTIQALVSEGFTHDCSAVPHSKANYDWSALPRMALPYHPSNENYQKKGDVPLLIVPVSRALFGISANPESALICGLSWLKACFLEYYSQGASVFHIALHSPTMTDVFYRSIMKEFLFFIARHKDIRFRFASEIPEYANLNMHTNIIPYMTAINSTCTLSAWKKAWQKI
jgi:peptidoglycan/xylan/chitin deacetylase (PgdA/CDA1 family)